MKELPSFLQQPYFSADNVSNPSSTSDYEVVITDAEVGDPGIAFTLSLKPKSDTAKKIKLIEATVKFTDSETKKDYLFKGTIYGNVAPYAVSTVYASNKSPIPFVFILPFEDPSYTNLEKFDLSLSVKLTYMDGTTSLIPNALSENLLGSGNRFKYGLSNNLSNPSTINRPSGTNHMAIQQIKVADNALGFTLDWSSDLDNKIHNFGVWLITKDASTGITKRSSLSVGTVSENAIKNRPMEIILPVVHSDVNHKPGDKFDYYLTIEYVRGKDEQFISNIHIDGNNQYTPFSGTTEMMTYSL